mmetsp:Transcript_10199/g.33751  ORF Transcript_10199/g.33751 Transcript_10199/m.33751 type:complete len:421 (-) Transcript_10199:622-1884(-)
MPARVPDSSLSHSASVLTSSSSFFTAASSRSNLRSSDSSTWPRSAATTTALASVCRRWISGTLAWHRAIKAVRSWRATFGPTTCGAGRPWSMAAARCGSMLSCCMAACLRRTYSSRCFSAGAAAGHGLAAPAAYCFRTFSCCATKTLLRSCSCACCLPCASKATGQMRSPMPAAPSRSPSHSASSLTSRTSACTAASNAWSRPKSSAVGAPDPDRHRARSLHARSRWCSCEVALMTPTLAWHRCISAARRRSLASPSGRSWPSTPEGRSRSALALAFSYAALWRAPGSSAGHCVAWKTSPSSSSETLAAALATGEAVFFGAPPRKPPFKPLSDVLASSARFWAPDWSLADALVCSFAAAIWAASSVSTRCFSARRWCQICTAMAQISSAACRACSPSLQSQAASSLTSTTSASRRSANLE